MIGKTISHYKILEKLGEGGMGVVYKAEDTKLQRTVALKFLPAEFTRNPDAKARFMKEARAASALDHPRIGTIYEINDTDDGHMYISMAYYEGETLKEVIKRGPRTPKQAIELVLQVANGLATAHDKEIIHRDIKPANIIITKEGFVKIVDFGLAKLGDTTKITKSGTSMGTPAYMAPEQVKGMQVDHRCDLWSLGIIFYELLTGRLPFTGDNEMTMMYSIVNDDPPPPSLFNAEVPSQIEELIQKTIAKELDNRYKSMHEFIKDLKQVGLKLSRGQETVLLEHDRGEQQQLPPEQTMPDADQMKTIAISGKKSKSKTVKPKKSSVKPMLAVAALLILAILGVLNSSKIKAIFKAEAGYVKIESLPAGATIALDGKESGKTTPAVVGPLDKGLHQLSLAAVGFETWSKELSISESDTILESVQLIPVKTQTASLEITSNPEGAAIFFDSMDMGQKTPATLENLSPGAHSIRLTKDGYEPVEEPVTISSGVAKSFSASLTKLPPRVSLDNRTRPKKSVGSLLVESEPQGALISMNGKSTGRQTPYRFTGLQAGNYKILLTLNGYEDEQQNEKVYAGGQSSIKIQLREATPGFLFVQAFVLENGIKRRDASKINVYINGKRLGTGWTTYEIKSGIHSVTAEKPGYKLQQRQQQIRISGGQTKNIELIFVKE